MKRARFHAFTLIEVMISLGLMALILSTLTYFFQQVNTIGRTTDRIRKESFSLRNLENRLSDIIPKATSASDPAGDFIFYTSQSTDSIFAAGSPSLVFTFDNDVNLVDPNFSNHVLGKIFLDKNNNLTLAIWPSPKRWEDNKPIPMIREVLYENVEALAFDFFIPPERDRELLDTKVSQKMSSEKKISPEPKGSWAPGWKYDYNELPVLIKLTIKVRTIGGVETRVMTFPLVNNDTYIVYEK